MTEAVAVTETTAPVTATPEVIAETPATPPATTETPVSDDVAKLLKTAREVFGDEEPAAEAEKPAEAAAESTEKPAEAPPKPSDKVAEKIARAHRAEERVKKQLEASQHAKMELAREREQLQREREAIAQERAVYARLKSGDPLEVLDALGADKLDFVKRVAAAPEVVDPVAAKVAQLEARAEAAERMRIQAEQAHAERVFQQNISQAKQGFVEMLDTNADKFPNIVKEFTPEEAADRALHLTARYNDAYMAKYGKPIDDAAVAEYLEYEAEQRAASRTWGKGRQVSQNQQSLQSNRAATSQPAEVTHTLTNSGASTASVPTREKTQQEIDEECIRILAAAHGG